MNWIRFYLIAAVVLVALAGVGSAWADEKPAAPKDPSPAPTAAEIDAWISQLNDDRYLVREQATRQLQDSGSAALDKLQAAADADRPEPADRSIWILRRLSNSKDLTLKREALERLADLKKRPQVAAAARDMLATIRHREAREAIEQLGGKYVESEFLVQVGAIGRAGRLDLDSRWHGGDAGLVHLRHLSGMRMIRICATDISAEALNEQLPHCTSLQTVWLYGTKLTLDDVAKLRKLLPEGVEVDYRKGALLGVASMVPDGPGPAVVRVVTPGSAAAAAGIQPGDVIQKFNGEPLANFKALTQKIGDQRPGDEVTLAVVRNGTPMDFKVTLGQWKTFDD